MDFLNTLQSLQQSKGFDSKAVIKSLLFEEFFEGFDPSKIDCQALMQSLMEDSKRAEVLGTEPEPSERSLALAGLDKQKFLQMSERAASNFNRHSAKGRENIRKLRQVGQFDRPELNVIKDHMLDLTALLNRSEVSRLAAEWNVDLNLFKCHTCNVQQKQLNFKLRRCGGCGEVYYCSKECQQAHWKQHKLSCTRQLSRASSKE